MSFKGLIHELLEVPYYSRVGLTGAFFLSRGLW